MARSGRVEGLSASVNANDVPGNRLYRRIVLYRKLTNYSYSALHDFRRICLVASGGRWLAHLCGFGKGGNSCCLRLGFHLNRTRERNSHLQKQSCDRQPHRSHLYKKRKGGPATMRRFSKANIHSTNYCTRLRSIIQSVSHVLPPSVDSACSQ